MLLQLGPDPVIVSPEQQPPHTNEELKAESEVVLVGG